MLESIHTQEPLLINTIGHSVGLLLFAGLLVLLIRDGRKGPEPKRYLPAVAALVALGWNAGSLVVLASSNSSPMFADVIAALSFGVLSLLPALLLHLSLEGRSRSIWVCGYILSGTALVLHLAELFGQGERLHQAALWVIIVGFGPLTLIAMFAARRDTSPPRHAGPRILAGMCLFLLAISFVHFRQGRMSTAWTGEVALHHAGIPLALYVLLQDYRFLLVDAFLRFLASGLVASGIIVASVLLNARFAILGRAARSPFLEGVLIVGGGLLLVGLVWVRGRLQLLLTRVVFRRSDREPVIRQIRDAGSKAESEAAFLERAAAILAAFMRTPECEVSPLVASALDAMSLAEASPVTLQGASRSAFGAPLPKPHEVSIPLRFAKGDGAVILLGRREGGRRYLSEDFHELGRMAAVIVEQVERLRNSEIQRLVSQAELRALRSQINPHFLFNSLNTLYGTIPRDAGEARRMVLNLAEIFRYCLKPERNLIPLAEEVQIISAYLDIEKLRLGDKLHTTIDVDPAAGRAPIPILSIQPLIENAVKHGVATRGEGAVALRVRTHDDGVLVEVSDDGSGFAATRPHGGGLGLDNVRQRLRLCFGEKVRLEIDSNDSGTKVSFRIPAEAFAPPITEAVPA
jgi:two-component system, LytTR family, sensor kinase